jgi:hypothetical protein
LRYDEDYSYLRDPTKRVDALDSIKYIPLCGRDNWYLTLGGEIRERYESVRNELFGFVPANPEGFNRALLQRYHLLADLHLGDNFRVFTQIESDLESGRVAGPRPDIDENTFALHQGFFDWRLPWGDANSTTLRLGRQEMSYGSGRLIDNRAAPNNMLSFDEVRLLNRLGDWSVDAFWSRPVLNRKGALDDGPDPNRALWGVYSVHPVPSLDGVTVDLYYLGYENKIAAYHQGVGNEQRNTLGMRVQGRPKSGWEYNDEVMWQFGTFAGGNLQAWSVATATRYNFSDLPWRPRFGVRADISSGDNNPLSPTLNTFNALFPSGVYYNLANPVGPSNIIDVHPVLDLYFSEKLTLTMEWDFFWRESLNDGVYTLGGQPIPQLHPSSARYVGDSPAVTVVYNPTRHVTLLASYVHFFPGQFITQTTPGHSIDYFTTWLTYKF